MNRHNHPLLSALRPIVVALLVFSSATGLTQDTTPTDQTTAHQAGPKGKLPLDDLRRFADVFNHIRLSYVEEVDDKTLLEYAIRGMLQGLDPHSSYLDAQSFEDLQVNTTGEFGGLGMEVGMENGFIKVITPIDDTPAKRAGVESGDLIIKLDGKPIKGLSLNEAVNLMRGPKGSPVELTIVREGKPFDLIVTRDTIKVVSVRSRSLEPGFAYIRIAQFQSNTGIEFRKALKKANQDNESLNGLVIDLRNNPGGVLQASVDVVDSLVSGGVIVYTEGRIGNANSSFSATADNLINNTPIVVLINGGSASASEIVAGALQDHHRAVIMGTDSFGKGSVQTVVPLAEDSAIKLTTARYFTPSGRSIQAQGIAPDIIVERAKIESLPTQAGITEADLQGHLENDSGDESTSKDRQLKTQQKLYNSDNQLYEALNLLKGLHVLNRNESQIQKDTLNNTKTL